MMATQSEHPTAFISYSWDGEEHRSWVRDFATRLRADGISVTLDQWHAAPGDQLPAFMETAIRDHDLILLICTPKYKERSDGRTGGVGYEGDVMTAEVLARQNQRKFIPILRKGDWQEAAPSWVLANTTLTFAGIRIPRMDTGDSCLHCTASARILHQLVQLPPRPRTHLFGNGRHQEQRSLCVAITSRHTEERYCGVLRLLPSSVTMATILKKMKPAHDGVRHACDEVELMRSYLKTHGIVELAFGKSRNGYSWALLVDSVDVELLDELVWTCWPEGSSDNSIEKGISRGRLYMFRSRPVKDRCDEE